MLNYYQPFLLPFLKLKPNPDIPSGISQYYYHSFEDGLWDLIKNKFPKNKKLTFLVPDFYCSDVLDNIKSRGHKYIYYPLDQSFQTTSSRFQKYLSTFAPDVIIIFSACGITSELLLDTSWQKERPAASLIIEDSVHRLVNPQEIKFLNDNHFIIDSLRKVTPLPGSRMFGTSSGMNFHQSTASWFSIYCITSFLYYLAFRFVLMMGFILNNSSLVSFAHNTLLKKHDDIIGDSITPHPGLKIFLPLINHLDYQKVRVLKVKQTNIYYQLLGSNPSLVPMYIGTDQRGELKGRFRGQGEISKSEFGHLHVFPLVFNSPPNPEFEKILNQQFPIWFKFTDTPWSQDKSVLFLPLGFHVSESEIKLLSKHIQHYFRSLRQGELS